MHRIRFLGNSELEIVDVPVPDPEPGEALVKITFSALCGTEIGAYKKGLGGSGLDNPGHELVGVVVKGNGLRHLNDGQRVGFQILIGCGECYYCIQDDPKHCINKPSFLLNGHAEYITAPEICLVPLPKDLDWESAVLLCGDTLGTPYHAIKRAGGVNASEVAAIFGFGPIGLGMFAWLKFFGTHNIVSEPNPYRIQLAKTLGADLVLNPQNEEVAGIIQDNYQGADICFDCAGVSESLNDALNAVRIKGRVCLVGEKNSATISPTDQIIHKELDLAASWYFTRSDFFEQLSLWRRHSDRLAISQLITHRYPYQEASEAFARFTRGETGKVVLTYPE